MATRLEAHPDDTKATFGTQPRQPHTWCESRRSLSRLPTSTDGCLPAWGVCGTSTDGAAWGQHRRAYRLCQVGETPAEHDMWQLLAGGGLHRAAGRRDIFRPTTLRTVERNELR